MNTTPRAGLRQRRAGDMEWRIAAADGRGERCPRSLRHLLRKGAVPTVYVSTVPAELIVLKGQPALSPITGTDILEVTNTDDDLFLYTPQQEYYALLSGRWFRAGSLQGPWEFVASGDLPPDFARIGGFNRGLAAHGLGHGFHGGGGHHSSRATPVL